MVQVPNVVGYIEEGKKVAKKQMDIVLHGLWGPDTPSPLQACFSSHPCPNAPAPDLAWLPSQHTTLWSHGPLQSANLSPAAEQPTSPPRLY